MNLSSVENKINEIFSNSEDRKIILWYDESEEFIDEIIDIRLDDAELFKLNEDNWIYAKYYIESVNPEVNYLIYAPFSKPSDKDNYLADMAHYATLFSADKLDIILQELNIPDDLKEVMELYPNFWNANSRTGPFKKLSINEYNRDSIERGILAVLSKEKSINFEYILRSVIVNYFDGNNSFIDEFDKYGILNRFWEIVYQHFGYDEENPNINNLMASLILNYSAYLFDEDVPKSWDRFLVKDKNNHKVFMDNFMNNTNYTAIYDNIANNMASKLKIVDDIKNFVVDAYIHCDSFDIFDCNIIRHYVNTLYENKEKIDIEDVLDFRKSSHFYDKYKHEYELLNWANMFIYYFKEFQREILPDDATELINIFENRFTNVDKCYRKFYYYYDKISDVDYIADLRQLLENMYDTFLLDINSKFTSLVDNLNNIDIPKQWNFYKRFVFNKEHKTAVIISDALRYGCAIELKEELDKISTRNNKIVPMLSTVPSYTALGMGALLPHKEIRYEGNKILVDGKPCISTEDRDKLLKQYNSNAIAVKYDDIINLNKDERRTIFKGKKLAYIYHDQIDARGDNASTENEVFAASQEAIDEIIKLVAKLTDEVNFVNFIITADHGYIYKRDTLNESNKVNLDKVDAIYKNKRFLLTNEKTDILATKCFSLDYIDNGDLFVTVPVGVDVFKTKGAGLNYVHGGLSLEEVIVPVLEINTRKGNKNQEPVKLQLVNSINKITNHEVMLTFFQEENISKNVLPFEASIYFIDSDGNRISNEVIIYADKNSEYAEDRKFMRQFTLKRINYSKDKRYYLRIDNAKGEEVDHYEFIIDIAFQDGFNFM